jgi:hypothetical protein
MPYIAYKRRPFIHMFGNAKYMHTRAAAPKITQRTEDKAQDWNPKYNERNMQTKVAKTSWSSVFSKEGNPTVS